MIELHFTLNLWQKIVIFILFFYFVGIYLQYMCTYIYLFIIFYIEQIKKKKKQSAQKQTNKPG